MSDPEPTCWYSVQYLTTGKVPWWEDASLPTPVGTPSEFTHDIAIARTRLTASRHATTKMRRLLEHTIKDGVIYTSEAEVWVNPNYKPAD